MRTLTVALAVLALSIPSTAQQMSMPMSAASRPAASPSTSLTLTLNGASTTLSLADLAALPHKSVTVHNMHTKTDETYAGVPLAALLASHGAPFDKSTESAMLHSYLVATGTDKYSVIYSTVEVFPEYHTGDVIVADQINGKPIPPDQGALKLISTEDAKPMRWVRNLTSVSLISPADLSSTI